MVVVDNIFHHKKNSGSNIYAKFLFLHVLTDVIPLPQLTEQVKLGYLKKLLSNNHLQKAAQPEITCSKLTI